MMVFKYVIMSSGNACYWSRDVHLCFWVISQKYIWLSCVIKHVNSFYDIPKKINERIAIYDDNISCIAQVNGELISNETYIFKFFYTHVLHKFKQIDLKQIQSSNNFADLLKKRFYNFNFYRIKIVETLNVYYRRNIILEFQLSIRSDLFYLFFLKIFILIKIF